MEEFIKRYKDEVWDNIWEESKKVYLGEKLIFVGLSVFYIFAMREWYFNEIQGKSLNRFYIIFAIVIIISLLSDRYIEGKKRRLKKRNRENIRKLKNFINKEKLSDFQRACLIERCDTEIGEEIEDSLIYKSFDKYMSLIMFPFFVALFTNLINEAINIEIVASILVAIVVAFPIMVMLDIYFNLQKFARSKDRQMFLALKRGLLSEQFDRTGEYKN